MDADAGQTATWAGEPPHTPRTCLLHLEHVRSIDVDAIFVFSFACTYKQVYPACLSTGICLSLITSERRAFERFLS